MSDATDSLPSDNVSSPGNQLDDLEVDHEQFMGDVIKDPWADDEQKDWPNHPPVELNNEEDA